MSQEKKLTDLPRINKAESYIPDLYQEPLPYYLS